MTQSSAEPTGPHDHLVQFYEEDGFLIEEVSAFLGAGLDAGQGGLVIATSPHRAEIDRRVAAGAVAPDQYVSLDASETVSRFMVDGWPDERRFAEAVEGAIQRAGRNGRSVRAFGEMVALLWADGRREAALRVEQLWNELARSRDFSLLCAYPMGHFQDEEHGELFLRICDAHTAVRPTESFLESVEPAELRRQVAFLQHRAAALETEVAKRKESERALRRLEEELRRRAEQLAEEDRRKDEFLAVLGHELRNPLSVILGGAELMRLRADEPGQVVRWCETVARQSALMRRLIDDLLDVSRITRGKIELRRETVLLGAVVEQAVELVRPLVSERDHRLSVDLPAEPFHLFGDSARLVQIVSNLLQNAAKYTDPGGNIALSARADGAALRICVRDDGMGLAAEDRERLFDPFVQASASLDRAPGGLGVGLALVRGLVELHGGSVEALSDGPGHGSEFVVRLPLADGSS